MHLVLVINKIVFILIEQINGKPINGKLDTDVVLHCPYLSSGNHPIVWFGPITSSGYTDNERINPKIPIHERLSLSDDNNTGEYNLNIHHLTRRDQGLYRCMTVLNGTTVSLEYKLNVLSK